MKKILILLVIFGVSLSGLPAFSQEKAANTPLTLEECIQLALKNRPELEMAALDILQAEHQIKEAVSHYYPRLNLSAGYTRFHRPSEFEFDVDITSIKAPLQPLLDLYGITLPSIIQQEVEVGKKNWFSVSIDLQQPLFTFGRIKEGVRQTKIGHSIHLNQREKKRAEIIQEVKKGYYQFLLAREMNQLMKEAEARANVVAKMARIDYETSIPDKENKGATRIDYLKARNFHSEMKVRLGEADKNLKLALLALKMTLGVNTGYPLNVADVPLGSMPMTPIHSEVMKEKARERNIDLKSLDLGVQLFDAKRRLARKEYLPKIGLQGQYVGPEDRYGTKNSWYAGIGLTMPIFDGFSIRAKVGQAEAQFQKTSAQRFQMEAALTLQIDRFQSTLKELQGRVEILQTAIQEAQERTQLAADGYAVGVTEYDELLLAQRTELEMKSAYLQSLYLYQATLSELELVAGE